jgi:hypothetical protein
MTAVNDSQVTASSVELLSGKEAARLRNQMGQRSARNIQTTEA